MKFPRWIWAVPLLPIFFWLFRPRSASAAPRKKVASSGAKVSTKKPAPVPMPTPRTTPSGPSAPGKEAFGPAHSGKVFVTRPNPQEWASQHFKWKEIDKHGDTELNHLPVIQFAAMQLDVLRDAIGEPLYITPTGRTETPGQAAYRKKLGKGERPPGSHHRYPWDRTGPTKDLTSCALDVRRHGGTPAKHRELADKLRQLILDGKVYPGGVGVYAWGVHYDTRGKLQFWDETNKEDD